MSWQTKADYLCVGAWLILAATIDSIADFIVGLL
jgi:hypothetical protein